MIKIFRRFSRLRRNPVPLLAASVAAIGGFAGFVVQEGQVNNPLIWVAVCSGVVLSTLSVYPVGDKREIGEAARRRQLIRAVDDLWIAGVLRTRDSLPVIAGSAIPLAFVSLPRMVETGSKRLVGGERVDLPTDSSLTQLFDDFGHSLLLLGAPGAGKTTQMLQLANALLDRARASEERAVPEPVPVVTNLATWAERRVSLERWLVECLIRDYNVPGDLARTWVTTGQLVLLLDGLDDVRLEHRAACIAAINHFRRRFPGSPTVVCCRTAEYLEAGQVRLFLGGAVEIQPLCAKQIFDYLERADEKLSPIRTALAADPGLAELLTTPFMLNIAALTQIGHCTGMGRHDISIEERRTLLMADYVDQSLRYWAPTDSVPVATKLRWLQWIATALHRNNQTVLHMLWMQPRLAAPMIKPDALVVLAALSCGLGGLVLSGLIGAVLANLPYEVPIAIPRSLLYPLCILFVTGTTLVGGYSRIFAPAVRVRWTTAQVLADSRRGAVSLLGGGLPVGLLFFWIGGCLAGLVAGLAFGCILALVVMVESGLRALREEDPSDGRRLSSGELIFLACRFGVPCGIVVGAVYGFVAAYYFSPRVGLAQGVVVAAGFAIFCVYFLWLSVGGRAYVQHAVLRLALVRREVIPWRLEKFLDTMVRGTIMRRQAGGYAFFHDLLHAHLAEPVVRAERASAPGIALGPDVAGTASAS